MSMYQMINGVSPATFFILPMLGKHPDEYPRFRDCFVDQREWKISDDGMPHVGQSKNQPADKRIFVFTRTGGGNREEYAGEIAKLRKLPEYDRDFDDDFDSTYMTFVFKVPEKFANDYDLLLKEKLSEISEEYKKQLYKIYPKLKSKFDSIFKKKGGGK